MKDIIKYKEFYTMINYEAQTKTYWGKIENINDFITFEANTVEELEEEFEKAVEEYIQSKIIIQVAK